VLLGESLVSRVLREGALDSVCAVFSKFSTTPDSTFERVSKSKKSVSAQLFAGFCVPKFANVFLIENFYE
jgi:hypothetical protein